MTAPDVTIAARPRGLQLSRYLLRRMLQAVPVLLLVSLGVFVLLEMAEGDAVDAYLAGIGGADAAFADELRERYGLNEGLGGRFLTYATRLATFDLGHSFAFSRSVGAVILERLPNTVMMMVSAILLSAALGTVLGGLAALRRGRPADTVISVTALVLNATPGFWLGLLGIILFAVKLRWLPVGGLSTYGADLGPVGSVLDIARHLVLPVFTLALTYLALYVRLMRGAMIDAGESGWVAAARARGVPSRRIALRHMARPAMLPVVTMIGLQAGTLLGGSVVIESVFAIPGLGALSYEAVSQRDMPLLAGILLAGTVLVVVVNIVIDLIYGLLDPRVELDGTS
ncbi:ABC transporter permease [Chachezhania antarctica]|uniref:ABC transporter permease n=1 Tax=Chachezhania antarctica TaxID=2340860 RepID=UPI0019692203|nr:ABC transporter permease [Chachezhania antarctica]